MTKANKIVIGVIVVLLVIGGAFAFKKAHVDAQVATVNGVAITKKAYDDQYALLVASMQAQGLNPNDASQQEAMKKQVLDNLIINEVLLQQVKAAGITTTDAEVETQYQALVTQNGGADGFKTALAKAGQTEASLRANIKNQLLIQKYLVANVKVDAVTASDTEISDFYNQYKQANGTSTPPLKDVSAQIKQQIILNKQQSLVGDFVNGLKAKATIVTKI